MDKFVVSARKYRPQNFETVVGQTHITTTLKNAITNNQLAHAFLFCGPRGVGKTTCARILAKTINCTNRTPEGEACNTCNSCVSFDNGTSMNIHELDAASNNSVDDIRVLVEQVRFAPQAGDYKVYIVDEVHMLSPAAFNAFLKTLEEPPSYAIFILATTEKHKILPTILSRCQIFDFKRITNADTVAHLREICNKENIKAEKTALHLISQKSEGCMRDALSIMDKIVSFTDSKITYANTLEHLNILDEDYYFRLLDYTTGQQLSDALLLYDDINGKGFEGDTFMDGFIEFIRNLLVSTDEKAVGLLEVADDFKKKYIEKAKDISPNWLISALNILTDASIAYKQSRNKRLFVELTLIKLAYLHQAVEISENSNAVSKKKLTDDAKPVSFRQLTIKPIKEKEEVKLPKYVADIEPQEPSVFIQTSAPPIPEPELPNEEQLAPVLPKENSSLSKIKEKIRKRQLQTGELQAKPLTQEELVKSWEGYVEKLREKKLPSSVSAFCDAVLDVTSENEFNITINNPIQQKFIEAERGDLSDYLREYFNNKQLKYSITLDVPETPDEPVQTVLTSRQQYEIMIADNPLIKLLKEKLKLELG